MNIRGKGAEIAFGISGLAVAVGLGADVAAEHFDIDQVQVDQLKAQEAQVQDELNLRFPKLEAMVNNRELTVKEADELGTDPDWFDLRNELTGVKEDLADEQEGSNVLNAAGRYLEIVGGALGAASLFVVAEKSSRRKLDIERETQRVRAELRRDYSLEGKILGLDSPGIPKIDLSDTSGLLALDTDNAAQGFNFFVKHARDEASAAFVNHIAETYGLAYGYDRGILNFMEPLFERKGAPSNLDRKGAYDARGAHARLLMFVERCAQLQALDRHDDLGAVDPNRDRLQVSMALHILDDMLPLQQDNDKNPRCEDGRHWVDFVDVRTREIQAEKYPVEI